MKRIARLVRSLRSREQKPKIFLTFLLFLGGGCGGSRQKMERKFLVLLRRFSLRKEHYYFIMFDCSFLRPHGDRGAPISAFGDNSKLCGFDGRFNLTNLMHNYFLPAYIQNCSTKMIHISSHLLELLLVDRYYQIVYTRRYNTNLSHRESHW